MNKNSNLNSNKKPCITVIRNNLKILSWNIQSPSSFEGNKFENSEFLKILVNHDFACLQEIRRDVHISGFRSICNTRSDKKYGGVGILIRNELSEGTELIKSMENSDYLVCKLNKEFFNLSQDTFIINSYIKPYNSSSSTKTDNGKESMKHLEDVINDLRQLGDIILCGDFNARIGQKSGTIEQDSADFVPLPDDYVPDDQSPRYSQDTTTNTYGNHFLNLVKHNQLLILNGRTLGDLTGQFTSIQKNGCSVIDYFAITPHLKSKIDHLKVLEFTHFSDHRPLSLQLKCNKFPTSQFGSLKETFETAPCRFIFNEENIDQFLEAQSDESSKSTIIKLNDDLNRICDSTIIDPKQREHHIKDINIQLASHLQTLASKCFKKTKPLTNELKTNNPWFNWKVRIAKREYRKATDAISQFPSSEFLRTNFYKVKGCYKKVVKRSTKEFFEKMNTDIEEGKVLNWQSFKKLKSQKTEKLNLDSFDMNKFESFFNDLYSDKHQSISNEAKSEFLKEADTINNLADDCTADLNATITADELNSAIKSLKTGKASSKDMISNEILKNLDKNHLNILLNLFNSCYNNGIYPWNESIITPLHKKGDKSDPDNYRAVAVSSVVGKLFSTILLDRLIKFRTRNCPDPRNQLGFTKKAQTYDHILTMRTIASKYKSLRQPVYAVFVDFKKAFDSVCRQALFLKLAKNGITGKFFNTLRNMYSNSFAYIKLSGHLSHRFQILKGTEQGHPLSPDLFKIFLSDLSPLLEHANCPTLDDIKISHLLWADDLILLSLDQKTSQLQLDSLTTFCNMWGIEINELKTQAVIFGREVLPEDSLLINLQLNAKPLTIVESYCYLGISLHQSGEVKLAQHSLKTKSMRAFLD